MSPKTLRKATQSNLLRLANWLKLNTLNMSHKQIIKLVYWRITREYKRNRGLTNTYY